MKRPAIWKGSHNPSCHLGHLEGEQPYLGALLTMVINHLLTGMILQALPRGWKSLEFLGS